MRNKRAAVSVLGLGIMGRPMTRVLLAAGWDVRGWNRSMLSEDLTNGISLFQSLEAAAEAGVILLMLTDANAVKDVLSKIENHLSSGQIILDMGSSDPEHSQIHAERLAAIGVGWVDAPVSGGPKGAASGTRAIMAGGTEADFKRVRPLLTTLGGNVVHVGAAGAGHTVKVINQLIVGIVIEAVAEGLTLAEKVGIDPSIVQAALQGGLADSKVLQIHGTRMRNRDYTPGGRATSQLKDLKMAVELAASASIDLPHLQSTVQLYEILVANGDGELDHSALHKLLY